MQRTISAMVGKGSVNHNSRKFRAENVDGTRTHLNIDYCNENIKTVYHELFDEALERYNAKQIRSDRKIKDFLTPFALHRNIQTARKTFIYGLFRNLVRYSNSTKTNAFCLGIILCNVSRSFDYLIYPYYPAYTS